MSGVWGVSDAPAMHLGPSLQVIAQGDVGNFRCSYSSQKLQDHIDRADATKVLICVQRHVACIYHAVWMDTYASDCTARLAELESTHHIELLRAQDWGPEACIAVMARYIATKKSLNKPVMRFLAATSQVDQQDEDALEKAIAYIGQ
jgi:hypothetical protein